MEKNIDQAYAEFNERATKLFFSFYDRFTEETRTLDRRKDENVFQHIEGKYLYSLKKQLDELAKELMNKHRGIQKANEMQRVLSERIMGYQNEFIRKARIL